jgi:uncharacterized protein (DUF2147 family)
VQIRSCGQALCGYASGANPNDTDQHNPDASKRNRPVNGMPVLIDMKPAKNDHWEGQAYNPTDAAKRMFRNVFRRPPRPSSEISTR